VKDIKGYIGPVPWSVAKQIIRSVESVESKKGTK
jgi:hypothetical protein